MKIVGTPLWLASTNSWMVSADDRECIVIDCPPEPDVILRAAADAGLRIVAIVATHGHIDHTGGIPTVAAKASPVGSSPVPVHRHPHDHSYFTDPVGSSSLLGAALAETGLDLRPPELLVDLGDGDVIKGAGLAITVIHTPGHTPGSVCLRVAAQGEEVLFTGDHLFSGSIGRVDLPGGSMESLMRSMVEKILPLPDELAVLPGHGPTTTIGRERAENPFLQRS